MRDRGAKERRPRYHNRHSRFVELEALSSRLVVHVRDRQGGHARRTAPCQGGHGHFGVSRHVVAQLRQEMTVTPLHRRQHHVGLAAEVGALASSGAQVIFRHPGLCRSIRISKQPRGSCAHRLPGLIHRIALAPGTVAAAWPRSRRPIQAICPLRALRAGPRGKIRPGEVRTRARR